MSSLNNRRRASARNGLAGRMHEFMHRLPQNSTRSAHAKPGQPLCGSPKRLARLVAVFALAAGTLVIGAGPASAHVELTSSDPATDTTVTGPLDRISLGFLNPITPVEDQFALLDGDGKTLRIMQILPAGEATTLEVVPHQPLAEGTYGLKWSARAGDSHPMVGTVSFTVAAPAAAVVPTETESERAAAGTVHPGTGTGMDHAMSAGLQRALEPPDTTGTERLAGVARFFAFGGLLLAVGGILYLAFVHRGTHAEGRRLIFLVRRAALLVFAGTLLELPLQAVILDGGSTDAIAAPDVYGELLSGAFGGGVLLRVLGAALVLVGMRMRLDAIAARDQDRGAFHDTTHDDEATLEQEVVPGRGGVATRMRPTRPVEHHRVRVEASPVAMAGAAALVASIAFIGHAASTEPRWLVVASALIHVTAGSLWVAGVAMLAATLWRRHRRGVELEAALLATRFSVAAVGAAAAVAITGLALGIAILGDLGSLFSTEFGRVLIVKVALVGVLVGLGAYNQKVLIPALERSRRRSRTAAHRLRRIVTAEVVTFLAVIAATAALVGSSST